MSLFAKWAPVPFFFLSLASICLYYKANNLIGNRRAEMRGKSKRAIQSKWRQNGALAKKKKKKTGGKSMRNQICQYSSVQSCRDVRRKTFGVHSERLFLEHCDIIDKFFHALNFFCLDSFQCYFAAINFSLSLIYYCKYYVSNDLLRQ